MVLGNKRAEAVTEADLLALKANGVGEGVSIDYKECLYGNSDEDRREFLFDVSSFANAAGGYLVLGMKEEQGLPIDLCGLPNFDADALKLEYENRLRDCIKPRIPGLTMAPVALSNGNTAFVIHVAKSFAAPHMAEFRKHTWFYSRNSAGKYRLDVNQLRTAFIQTEGITEQIRGFRAARIAAILGEETPVPLPGLPKVVLHGVPFNSFEPGAVLDLDDLQANTDIIRLGPGENTLASYRFNLDGYLINHTYSDDPQESFAYVQVFRTGAVEACITGLIQEHDGDLLLRATMVERKVAKYLGQLLRFHRNVGVTPPIVVMMTVLGVQGYSIRGGERHPWEAEPIIDRPDLFLPEVVIDDYGPTPHNLMKPVFDAMWNASGWPRSLSYDRDGNWKG